MSVFYSSQVEDCIEDGLKRGVPVAAVIVEPIQGEGGDRHASPFFFRELRDRCKKVKNNNRLVDRYMRQ